MSNLKQCYHCGKYFPPVDSWKHTHTDEHKRVKARAAKDKAQGKEESPAQGGRGQEAAA